MTIVSIRKENTFGAVMMVAGCCIGAGMVGMPVLSAAAGFLPSFFALCFSYVFTTASGLLLLEATLWFEGQVNLLSIAQFTLGRWGKGLVGVLFLSLFYAIFVAYLDGGGQMMSTFFNALFSQPLPREAGILACAGAVAAVCWAGVRGVDRINRILMLGLAACYCWIVGVGGQHVKAENLGHINWGATLFTLPILFICFGYQNLVPSLTHYLRKNVSAIRFAIVIGNLIPFGFYLLWNFVILGMIADPEALRSEGGLVTELVRQSSHGNSILLFVEAFAFFAFATSFLTISFSFVDFLRDGFKKAPRDAILYGLMLLPPLFITLTNPHLFLKALSFAGGFIDVILYGIIPVCIVWIGRYVKKAESSYRMAGGKPLLALLFFLSVSLLILNASNKL